MVERNRKKDGTIVNTVDTITDLGTLVIIDDPAEEDEIDTMKSKCWTCDVTALTSVLRNGHWGGGEGRQV